MGEAAAAIEIAGKISSVVYTNEENGYTVLRLDTGDGGLTTVVGTVPAAAPGELLRAYGQWVTHPSHGQQFKAEYAQRSLPHGVEDIYDYLAGRAVQGVGPATAALIVDRFGEETFDVLESHPEKLAQIKGVSAQKAKQISDSFRRKAGLRRLMEYLCAHRLRPILALKLYRFHGDKALELLRENPYILASPAVGGSFAEADELALETGVEDDDPARICAAVTYELQHNAGNGHCFIPADKLIAAAASFISVEQDAAEEGLISLEAQGLVMREPVAGCDACYLTGLHEAESYTAERLRLMCALPVIPPAKTDAMVDAIERDSSITYAPAQRDAIRLASRSRVMVITGGPGTGKTTMIRAILDLYERMGIKALLTAPTGRAAKRMGELTGRDAVTVHRLLGAAFTDDGGDVVFQKDESEPLDCGAVILDESSMVDITLMRALLCAMPEDSRLVMVGDADQLPSVGPGNVFSDVIRSELAPTVRLTEIFRQGEGSRIVESAHMINRGEHPGFGKNTGDFFFLRRLKQEQAADTVAELCTVRLPQRMHIPPEDIQVLTPTRRGACGTVSLNKRLQSELNPPMEGKNEKYFGEVVYREGDRVMQIRNNYDILWQRPGEEGEKPLEAGAGIYNGDVGYILGISSETETLTIDFDGRLAVYTFDQLLELEHAWAMTVHKAQGSEYRAVVLVISGGPQPLMTRSVLYTAVTRARELLIAVGDDAAADRMIDSHRQSRRYSGLRARLCV